LNDGAAPLTGATLASDGNLYGTCSQGGTYNLGTLYRLTPQGSIIVLHNFGFPIQDGAYPISPLVQATNGRLYGTTQWSTAGTYGGSVFAVDLNGTYRKIYDFSTAGQYSGPSGLIQASDGYLWGTLYGGGSSNSGAVFK